jgi:hypothetical protein
LDTRQYFGHPPTFWTHAKILGIRQNFHETPRFQAYANILGIRQNFHETPRFQAYANILGIRLYFHETPRFCIVANILEGGNILWICLILLLQILVYIFSIYFYAFKYAPIFLAQLF